MAHRSRRGGDASPPRLPEESDSAEDVLGDEEPQEAEEEGEDLFAEGMERDYVARPDLDQYELSDLDRAAYDAMPIEERRAVEAQLDLRDEARAAREGAELVGGDRRRRLPDALLGDFGLDAEAPPPKRRRAREREPEAAEEPGEESGEDREAAGYAPIRIGDLEAEEDETDVFYEEPHGPLREWIVTERPRRVIARKFYQMLRGFRDGRGTEVYVERVTQACQQNRSSFEVSYAHISQTHAQLAIWLADAPLEMLKIFDEVAFKFALRLFPEYRNIHPEISVRITDVPILDSLRDIRQLHLNSLVRTRGVVTRRTAVFPQLKIIKFDCTGCGFVLGPYSQSSMTEIRLTTCPACQGRGPFRVNQEQTIYRNYQKLTLQEPPGSVPPGRLPRSKEVIVLQDLVDRCRPGELVEAIGIFRHSFDSAVNEAGFPVFTTVIEANNIVKKDDAALSFSLTGDEIAEIRALAKDPQIADRIVDSLAPSIYGHETIKRALALALFGGMAKDAGQKHHIRGDINVLIVGDPGTAKSQFLKYCETVAHRARFTTGQGASAVGLTASVQKDPVSREWTLEGGALVLADNGVCLIDEFDKMNDRDRTSLHEAMEQQSISISKAGIVTSLQARCSVIAAANPTRGRYDASQTFSQNVDLTDPILSRFDILCVVRDTADPDADEQLAKFVVGSHVRSHPAQTSSAAGDEEGEPEAPKIGPYGPRIRPDLLRKYILYARSHIRPKLHNLDSGKITRFYQEMRKQSTVSGSVPIAVRHIESIIRITEAHARMCLREYCRADDADLALRVMTESFCGTQKFSVRRNLERKFQAYLTYRTDVNRLLHYLLSSLIRKQLQFLHSRHRIDAPSTVEVELADFEDQALEYDVHDLQPFYKSQIFRDSGFVLDVRGGKIRKSYED